jgi:hypothetical protein
MKFFKVLECHKKMAYNSNGLLPCLPAGRRSSNLKTFRLSPTTNPFFSLGEAGTMADSRPVVCVRLLFADYLVSFVVI